MRAASRRVPHRKVIELMPMTSRASTSSVIRMAPISATSPVPTLAAIMYPKA